MTVLNVLSISKKAADEETVEQSNTTATRQLLRRSTTSNGVTTTVMETESSDDPIQPESSADDESVANAVLQESRNRKKRSNKSAFHKAMDKIQSFRKVCGKFVNDTHVQLLIVLLIAINAIMLGIATYPFVKDNPERSRRFEITDQAFLIVFTVELALQFIYNGFRLFLDGWLVFDFIIIVTSWWFADLQIIRAFRIFRAFRLVTRVKVLQNLVTALFSVVPRIGAISILLLLIFFIFAILMTSLWKGLDLVYWKRLDATFFTLFQILTLDEWAGIARETMVEFSWAWFPIIAFVVITAFMVINLIIAVICDAISALHADQKAMIQGRSSSTDEEDDDEEQVPVESIDDINLKKQLDDLEHQVEELAKMQAQTMHSLQYLTRHLQAKKLA